jgi:hypothetical protein
VSDNDLVEDVVWRAEIFFEVKIYDLRSGDDDACAMFSFLKASLLKNLDFTCSLGSVCDVL